MLQGEIFAMLGHNGAGKTTTISMITGMLEATSGTVTCFGRHIIDEDISSEKRVAPRQLKKDLEYIRKIMGICP
jgi:ABC-type multidrug transport system ATPase subunit